ncbi:MAG: DNA-3-methyladenine glycosylase I [Cellvibrionaceae bacterium]|nr:DNA-3-methyladenine glycosylase I [Cellvibrionaceae bacterium]
MSDNTSTPTRCPWCGDDPLYQHYHDNEWGVPLYDDEKLFEFLLLEGAQAGLSWITILRKRENYRRAFDQFNPEKIAGYTQKKQAELLQNPGIVRNKLKISAFSKNAQAYLAIVERGQRFADYLWQFVDGEVIQNQWRTLTEVPSITPEAERMSKHLKKAGFTFVGPTICYAFMQATGMVNDHLLSCFRHRQLR